MAVNGLTLNAATTVGDLVAVDTISGEERYKALGARVSGYLDKLDAVKEDRLRRLRAEDDRLIQIIMETD